MPLDGDEADLPPRRETGSRYLPGGALIMAVIWSVGMVYLFVDLAFFRQ